MKTILIGVVASFFLTSCTDNERARNYGGQEEAHYPANEKFINITWKDWGNG